MHINYNKAMPLAKSALNARALRQDLISSNIANIDTPFYRPKDINFEDNLANRSREIFNTNFGKELKLAQTKSSHMNKVNDLNGKSTIFFRDGHMAKNDGNSVDLDVETTEMSKNSVMFNALISGMKKSGAIFKNVLESSSKLQ